MPSEDPAISGSAIRLVLVDLDGTLYEGSRVIAGAAEAVRRLRERGLGVRFTTNTDSIAPDAVVARLGGMGIQCEAREVLTPVVLAGHLLAEAGEGRALVIASPSVRRVLAEYEAGPGAPVTHVVVADPSYGADYAALDEAFRTVRDGAQLVATQMGRWVRRDDGVHLDTGGWVRLLEYAADVEARVLGKPSPDFFRLATDAAGVRPHEALVAGDDRAADVAGGRAAGCRTVLVRTGKGEVSQGPEPDLIVDSIVDVPDAISQLTRSG